MSASQADLWSGPVGQSWVRNALAYDTILEPLGRAALDRLDLGPPQRVLDIGCGTGTTTLEIGRRVRPDGSAVGVDVSRPMVECAQARLVGEADAENVEFLTLDVESEPLPGLFDAAFSRMGVMFFDRPEVAFSAVRAALRPGGRLAFVCFAAPAANPFITVPTGAALARLGGAPVPPPGAPGPFSFADPDRVRSVLETAGFQSVEVNPGPDEVTLGPADRLEQLARQALEQNPQAMMAMAANPAARDSAVAAAVAALGEHVTDGEVRLGAGTWVVEARAPGV